MKKLVYTTLGLCSLTAVNIAVAKDEPLDLGVMNVISTSPLDGRGVDANKLPGNIQTVTAEKLQKAQSISLADYINQYLGSVSINEAQNNPLQPDIYYRGFVASPLLGMPQGLSTYVNGVRFNEPFGDTVNWDLIPEGAIDSMALYGGSNPVYGLNSLGGAISVKTKTGFSAPGHQIEVYGGSWDRHSEELTSGWNNGTWGYFLDLNHFEEDGWRNFSPTKAERAFGTLSWRGDKGSLDLTLAANDNDMRGNGATPETMLRQEGRKSVFTHPDQTITRMFFSELAGSYDVTDDIEVSGNAYFRQNRVKSFNGDTSDYGPCVVDPTELCESPGPNEEEAAVIGNLPNDITGLDATNNTSQTNMRGRGGSLQSVFAQDLFKHKNNLTVGTSYDYSSVHFNADTELASLTDNRGTIGSGILVNEPRVRLTTNTSAVGVFLSDSFSITDDLTATVAGRYNYIHMNLIDKYGTELNGSHTFERLNPSAGLTYNIFDNLTVFGNYSESTRAPSPMELSCADPAAPCKLPNSFTADPPLEQVVAKTWEGGFRGDLNNAVGKGDLKWNLGYFHTMNTNDIIFRRDLNSGLISQGFFQNVGKTRRYGIEAGTQINYPQLFSSIDDWHFSTNYTYLNARFLSGFDSLDPLDHDQIARVDQGDKIPGIPEHIFKATIGVDLWQKLSLALDGRYSGDQVFRGDEANNNPKLSGYWVFNARAEYKFTENVALFGKLDNIFDNNYNSFGVYGDASSIPGNFGTGNDRFVSPGMPRAGWLGVRLSM
ncbi:MAG: TonB-dependent receptor [Methylococcaceae bacterium]|nr:TonB-dependent receptor [Methylococcaceae bacterium]MDZ4155710.1 TonB-dependent receptor [Methylococcales bacterium]MDP2391941.1 TonB-dependent receptor [Methylococcaceae bacterium]MDP3018820.1 TonB-dependent receptor [Methylococcaceae bacterium]MDP3391381.1 TonB-dependent receptor [Methylococcaceae bacterium]